jgi:hypothetical protein
LVLRVMEGGEIRVGHPKCQIQRRTVLSNDREGIYDRPKKNKEKKNSMASVCKRTIPTERPPLVSEVSANVLRIEGVTWSA